jgi:uncharacterized OsmC-like protein
MRTLVQDAQASLRRQYKQTPALAMVTDHARTCGTDPADPFHSLVEPMDGCGVSVPVGVHRAVGGLHDAPTPGDMLCAALAACQDSAVRMVANRLGIEITALEVRVTAQVDVRGALGIAADVPVGFQSMTCDIDLKVEEGTPAKLLDVLSSAAQRCCVVQQTLHQPPPVRTRFRVLPHGPVDAGQTPG